MLIIENGGLRATTIKKKLPLNIAMGNAGRTVDRYGFKLSNDATAHTRHTLHNSLRDRIIYFMRLSGPPR